MRPDIIFSFRRIEKHTCTCSEHIFAEKSKKQTGEVSILSTSLPQHCPLVNNLRFLAGELPSADAIAYLLLATLKRASERKVVFFRELYIT